MRPSRFLSGSIAWLSPGLTLLAAATGQGQLAAVEGASDWRLVETDVGAGPDSVMVVGIHSDNGSSAQGLRYGLRGRRAGGWDVDFAEGDIPKGLSSASAWSATHKMSWLTDPALAYDATDGGYLCVALGRLAPTASGHKDRLAVLVVRYTPGSGWGRWLDLDSGELIGFPPLDKPFVVAGEPGEFYVTWWYGLGTQNAGHYGYRRSTDGGLTWSGGLIVDDATGQAIGGTFAIHPSTGASAPLFTSYTTFQGSTQFVMGIDQPAGGLRFIHVDGPAGPLEMKLLHKSQDLLLPGSIDTRFIPQLAVDPTDVRDFYVAFHEMGPSGNVDSYVVPVRWVGPHWRFERRVRIHPDPPPPSGETGDDHTDQFLPAITVDGRGHVHVIYYDDQRFHQADGAVVGSFDVGYSVSTDGGRTYTATLYAAPPPVPPTQPANVAWLDTSLVHPSHPGTREYIGISAVEVGGGRVDVWGVCTGSNVDDPGSKSVLWSFRAQ